MPYAKGDGNLHKGEKAWCSLWRNLVWKNSEFEFFFVFLAIYIAKFFGLTIHYTCQSLFLYFSGLWFLIKVFILGYGNIGYELAKRLRPFGVKIIPSKRSWSSKSHGINALAALVTLAICCLFMLLPFIFRFEISCNTSFLRLFSSK